MSLSLHFLFADAELGYHCPDCNARCCRGSVSLHRELEAPFLARYPEMMFHLRGAPSHAYATFGQNLVACPLKLEDGSCHVHATHGYNAKPAACKLFPTNLNLRIPSHNTLLVGLNFFCPLQLARHHTLETVIHHAPTASLIRHQVERELHRPESTPEHLSRYPEDFLELERFLTQHSATHEGSYLEMLALHHVTTQRYFAGHPLDGPPDSHALQAAHEALSHQLELIGGLYGRPPAPQRLRPVIERRLAALTGIFRMEIFVGQQRPAHYEVASRLPRALAAFYALVEHHDTMRQRHTQSEETATLSELNLLFHRHAKTAWFLAHLDAYVVPPESSGTCSPDFQQSFRTFYREIDTPEGQQRTLFDHLRPLEITPILHPLMIAELAQRELHFEIVPPETA